MQLRLSIIEVYRDLDGVFSAILAKEQLKRQGINNFKFQSIEYGDRNYEGKFLPHGKQAVILVDFARISEKTRRPEFWSDHHALSSLPEKDIKKYNIGKTDYGSEATHLATVSAKNLADSRVLKAVNAIDSAKYSDLAWVVDLPKNFKQKGRMERLAIIVNTLLTRLLRTNQTAANELVKVATPSLANIYNHLLKFVKLNNLQAAAIKEFSKDNPDWKKVDEIRAKMPGSMAKEVVKGEKKRPIANREETIKKGEEHIARETNKETTTFKRNGMVLVQKVNIKKYPGRYFGSLMSTQDLERYPAAIKMFPTFIQVSLNPDLAKEIRDKVNLDEIRKKILQKVRGRMANKYNKWAFDIIERESGGHAAITNISGLGTIGLMPKRARNKLKELQALYVRYKKLKNPSKKFKDLMPEANKLMKDLEAFKKESAQARTQMMEQIKQMFIQELNKILPSMVKKKVSGQERFKVQNVKEEILWRLKFL